MRVCACSNVASIWKLQLERIEQAEDIDSKYLVFK
jgi:hypothetical protein